MVIKRSDLDAMLDSPTVQHWPAMERVLLEWMCRHANARGEGEATLTI